MTVLGGIGEAVGSAAAKKAGETFSDSLLKLAGAAKRAVLDRAAVALRYGFEAYLQSSYIRCRYFKTVLNPYEPADLAESYIKLNLNKLSSGEEITDVALFGRFRSGEQIVVTGLAGSGKSMLMRYLTIDSFDHIQYGTPLFVELRKINEYESKDLIDFVVNECTQKGKRVSRNQFELALRANLFTLILDGFDELEYEHRDTISDQINDLEKDYPGVSVIVSSRPDDDRFRSWTSFSVYKVADFSSKQAVELIEKTKYNEGVKERFLKALNSRLFKTHPTFLASPLLTTIMLLTFEEYAEIPTKMHSFYARAFDTLFQKHDADKDQFVRKIKTKLSKEDFKLVLSAFCAMSYLEQRFSFSAQMAEKTAEDSLAYSRQIANETKNVKSKDFLCDLTDAVCMLQPDGLDLVFVHRSFQEYFSAVFIEKSHGARVKSLLDKFSHRFNDNVVGMALDMAKEKVEAEWVVPKIDHYVPKLSRKNGKRNVAKVLGDLLGTAHVHRYNSRIQFSWYDLAADELGPLESICRSFPDKIGGTFLVRSVKDLSVDQAKLLLLKRENENRGSFGAWGRLLDSSSSPSHSDGFRSKLSQKDNWWLDALGFNGMFDDLVSHLKSIKEEIETKEINRQKIMEDFI